MCTLLAINNKSNAHVQVRPLYRNGKYYYDTVTEIVYMNVKLAPSEHVQRRAACVWMGQMDVVTEHQVHSKNISYKKKDKISQTLLDHTVAD